MGQKVHPYGFRLGFNKPWRSRWFAKQGYATLLREDLELKEGLRNRLKSAGISSIEVDRPGNKLRVTIRTSRPGIIIGRKGAEIEKLKQDLAKRTKREVFIDIQEVHKPELDAQLVSESIALQLEKRVAFRRAMRKAVDSALRFGCKGIKVRVSGRLNGAEIARSEWYLQGQLPLHTLRADIDYGFTEANTTYGVIGIKCWLYKGEILSGTRRTLSSEPEPRRQERRERGGDRDRDRRGPRGGHDRGPQGGSYQGGAPSGPAVQSAPPAALQHEGPATQQPPTEARRGGGPLMPPLMSPSQPTWKADVPREAEPVKPEAKPETTTEPTPGPETTPEGGSENQG
jgi:small subunit ribosomal protein S3